MRGLIIPKQKFEIPETQPLIFLAGPIGGAPKWHDEAVEILNDLEPDILIASPRWEISDKIKKLVIPDSSKESFPRARLFERYYLEKSQKNGAMMFWLPGEIEHKCSKSYGAMTRFELGQVSADYRNNPKTKFCVGTDGNFSEFRTIEADLHLDAPNKEIQRTLESTCLEALRIMRESA